jgi:hypothetical protein
MQVCVRGHDVKPEHARRIINARSMSVRCRCEVVDAEVDPRRALRVARRGRGSD